jgi:hypothetical protein
VHSRASHIRQRLQLPQRDRYDVFNTGTVHGHILLPGRQDAREHAPHRAFGPLSQSLWHNNHTAQMMDAPSPWNGQDANLSSTPHDEFFLDMGMNGLNDGLNFDFQDYGGQHNGQMLHQEGGGGIDTRMDIDVGILGHKDAMMQGQMPPMTTAPAHSSIAGPPIGRQHSSDSLVELDAQIQYLQQQRQQHQQRQLQEQQQRNNYYAHNRMVPPTPNSIEMHSTNNQFYAPSSDPQQQAYERYQNRLKEQEVCVFSRRYLNRVC